MVFDEAKAVRRGQNREIGFLSVVPFLLRARQCGFEGILVPDSWQPAVFPELVVVDGVNDQAA